MMAKVRHSRQSLHERIDNAFDAASQRCPEALAAVDPERQCPSAKWYVQWREQIIATAEILSSGILFACLRAVEQDRRADAVAMFVDALEDVRALDPLLWLTPVPSVAELYEALASIRGGDAHCRWQAAEWKASEEGRRAILDIRHDALQRAGTIE